MFFKYEVINVEKNNVTNLENLFKIADAIAEEGDTFEIIDCDIDRNYCSTHGLITYYKHTRNCSGDKGSMSCTCDCKFPDEDDCCSDPNCS